MRRAAAALCKRPAPIDRVRRSLSLFIAETGAASRKTPQASIEQIGGSISRLLNAASRREALSVAVLDQGADALLSSIRQHETKGWLAVVRRYDNVTRIVTICDIYGALLERRPYKQAQSPLEARAVLHTMADKLDPGFLIAFDAVIQNC